MPAGNQPVVSGSPPLRLRDVAHARSGDKGAHANIGVIAHTRAGWHWLEQVLTEARVAHYFLGLRPRRVVRYPLPGILAWNFVLEHVLDGGAGSSLRTDSQGKTLALALLEMELPAPPGPEVLPGGDSSRDAACGASETESAG